MQKGERLPNEKEFMACLNLSRTTIREAMRLLSSRGIVVIRQGSGTYISSTPGVPTDPLGLEFQYDKKKVLLDLLELRFIMEPIIAALSARFAGLDDVSEIQRLADEISKCIITGVNHVETDVAFHCKIAQSTGNDVLKVLFPEIVKGVRLFSEMLEDKIIDVVGLHHEKIAQAIANRDSMSAYQAMMSHLEKNRAAFEEYLGIKIRWTFDKPGIEGTTQQ